MAERSSSGGREPGGIWELTGREIGFFAEQSWSWSENTMNDVAKATNDIFQQVRTSLEAMSKDIGQALAKASEPPQLSPAARAEPSRQRAATPSTAEQQQEQPRRRGFLGGR